MEEEGGVVELKVDKYIHGLQTFAFFFHFFTYCIYIYKRKKARLHKKRFINDVYDVLMTIK